MIEVKEKGGIKMVFILLDYNFVLVLIIWNNYEVYLEIILEN